MIKYAVKYLKNTFVPLRGVPEGLSIENSNSCDAELDGKLVLVRTEKGEEVLKAFLVCPKVAERFENSNKTPEAFDFIRVMTQEDMMIYEEIKKKRLLHFLNVKS